VRAAKRLGWTEIVVVVRADLDAAGPAAAEAFVITSNSDRRQLSLLGRARCLQRLVEIECGRPIDRLAPTRKEEIKATIGERMGLTARSVNRYLSVLQTPREVQAAFDEGAISLVAAGKVAQLERRQQQSIAKRIAAGESAQEVVAEALRGNTGEAESVDASFSRLRKAVKREVTRLAGHVREINPKQLARCCGELRAAADFFRHLAEAAGTKSGAGRESQAGDPQRTTTTKKRSKGAPAPRGSGGEGRR
jgi:ParB-like chromosome segregation protein Spo0J